MRDFAPGLGPGGASKVDGCMRLPDDLHRQHGQPLREQLAHVSLPHPPIRLRT